MMKSIICFGLVLALYIVCPAQNRNLKFKHLSVQDGLSRSWVKCFLQDRTGLLWIGTADGLNTFDGKDFKIYKYSPGLQNSLNHNNTNVIYEDSKGQLWVGTQAGLNYYERDRDEFVPMPFINNYISTLYESHPDTLMVGTAGGLFLFNKTTRASRHLYYDLYIEKIIRDNRGNILLATHTGLMIFNPVDHSIRPIRFNSGQADVLSNGFLISMFQDSRGGIWVGTASQGLCYFSYPANNFGEVRFINFKPDPSKPGRIMQGAIYAIAEDEDHNVWFGIENSGINILNLDAFEKGDDTFSAVVNNPSEVSSLSNNSVHALYTDNQNTMWVGTYAGGVNHYNKLLQRFGHHEALPHTDKTINNKHVSSILDEDDYLWIGTEKGLNCYDKSTGRWRYFAHDFKNPKSIGSDAILSIARDSQKRLWVGTWNGGLNLFDEKTGSFKKFMHDPDNPASISGDNIYQIRESSDRSLWIGLMGGGLAVYDPEKNSFRAFTEHAGKNALSSNWVLDLLEDHIGNIWISTTEAVDMLDPKTGHFTTFTHDPSKPKSISYNGATCLFRDSRNTMWIGTSNGLNYFVPQDSSFRHYTVENGLPNNFIKAITEDREGNIWFSTNNTLTMFKEGTALPQDPVFKSFTVFDDLMSSEFVNHAVFRNDKGELYFGSTNGYFVFDPTTIKDNPTVPKILFTGLWINNLPAGIGTPGSPLEKDISVTTQLKLTRQQNVFTIGFAALNFIEPGNNQYAFKLEGFDAQWNYVGHQQSATYTNLDPGSYVFRVRASNNDGVWNEEGISLKIIVLPAWWQTWFAKVIYVALFIVAIFFFRKHTIISVNLKNVLWREHLEKEKSEELAKMKQEFFANVSHEIRTPLTLILGPLSKLINEKNRIPELNLIYRNSIRLKKLVDQFLDFTKMESQKMTVTPTSIEILELTGYIIADFTDYAGQRNVAMELKTTFSKCVALVDQDKYEKIVTNLLSNAVKSISGEGTVSTELEFDQEAGKLIVRITDTGRGITPEESEHIFERYYSGPNHLRNVHGTGIGLYLTRELVELQKGTIHVSSTVGSGSTFTVTLPVQVSEFEAGHDNILFHSRDLLLDNSPETLEEEQQQFEKTVLVIDDNEAICDYIETILSDEFNVIKERNPLNCFDAIIKNMPDVIISDVMMPEMDGFELCRSIKNDIRFSHIPVILLTAKTTRLDHIAGYETGADDYIYKPFDGAILKARVRSLIVSIEKLKRHFIGHDGVINTGSKINSLDVKFMEEIMSEIRDNYADPHFHVNRVIEKIGMSRTLFYKKFKTLSDQSFNDLLKNVRLKKAAELLVDENLSVSDVAYDCGFTDPVYFSRVFKEYYHVDPEDFNKHSKII